MKGVDWNRRGIALARQSRDPKAEALLPAMLNNMAWDLHDMGRFDEALTYFTEAQSVWEERDQQPQIRSAKWAVARGLRSLARHKEALDILYALEQEYTQEGSSSGYVYEEIAENLYTLDQLTAAQPYFQRAADELAQDEWIANQEPERLARLQNYANS